jgi:hypothetical protein
MKTRIEFRYIFLAIGGRVSHEWHVQADYEYTEHHTLDLEGDLANMPDAEETLTVLHVNDHTLGWDSGEIKFSELQDEHINEIIKTGLRAGRHEYKERIRNSIAHLTQRT